MPSSVERVKSAFNWKYWNERGSLQNLEIGENFGEGEDALHELSFFRFVISNSMSYTSKPKQKQYKNG